MKLVVILIFSNLLPIILYIFLTGKNETSINTRNDVSSAQDVLGKKTKVTQNVQY